MKIATFEVLHVKIAMIGGWLVGWLVGWWELQNCCAHPFLVNHCSNEHNQASANISRVFVGNMSPSPSSQIGVPSKALGAVGSCG